MVGVREKVRKNRRFVLFQKKSQNKGGGRRGNVVPLQFVLFQKKSQDKGGGRRGNVVPLQFLQIRKIGG